MTGPEVVADGVHVFEGLVCTDGFGIALAQLRVFGWGAI